MPRLLRIEFPDAWYHVMNSGRSGEAEFIDKEDYQAFTQVLIESIEILNLGVTEDIIKSQEQT